MTAQPEYRAPEDPVADALDLVDAGIETLSNLIDDRITDPEAAVTLLYATRGLRQRLASVEAFIEAKSVPLLDYGKQEVGGFAVEVRGGKERREWQHDKLAWDVTRDLALIGGAIEDERAAVVDLVRSRLMQCARFEWRMTPIRTLGLNPDDYAEVSFGRRTIQVTPSVNEEG